MLVMLQDLARVWRMLDPARLDRTLPDWILTVQAVVARYGHMSATLAADRYDQARAAAKAPGVFSPDLPDVPDDRQVNDVLRWATKGLWSTNPDTLSERLAVAEQTAGAAAAKMAVDLSRITVTDAVKTDPAAVGWARIAKPTACAFCRLLATRGGVYSKQTVAFRAHDGCICTAEPVFKGQRWEPSADVRQWQVLYRQAARAKGSTIINFRRLVEGRA